MKPKKGPAFPHRCLIVDDDRLWLNLLGTLLFQSHPILLEDPRKAMAYLRANRPDLLITDTNMPYLSGIELLKEVRAEREFKKLPVIVLFSGLSSSAKLSKTDVYAAGANAVLSKDEFLALHDRLIGDLLKGLT